jgi:ATP-dependent DNA helicase DinG
VAQARILAANIAEDEDPKLEDKKELLLLNKVIDALWAFTRPEENVLWLDEKGMHSSPIDITQIILDNLDHKATIFTSATIESNFGLDHEVVKIGGGFTNAGLYVSDCDGSGKYRFRPDAANETLRLVQAIGGRSLLLYTSEVAMMEMYHFLRTRLNVPVYHQKQPDALQLFKDRETSVLCGIETVWEGLDVPGPSLSLVVIDRLPFPNMADPIYEAAVARLGWFQASLPPTKTMFRQGAGRLLRSPEDCGVIAVLDCRLKTKGYGKAMLNSIQFQGIPSLEAAEGFLRAIREELES